MATSAQISTFIKQLGKLAVAECNRRISQGKGFVLPSVCIAQSALETGWGTAGIMVKANAYFGIKAGGSWTGAIYRADTWEVANGTAYNTSANFRAYGSLAESVTDYYDLIGNATRYAKALSFTSLSSQWKTPKECITAIWAGGYATDTLYVEKIMSTINARGLTAYDKLIDGVTFDDTGVSTTFKTYSKGDFVNGVLVATDSNRTVSNADGEGYIALDWSKAYEGQRGENVRINTNHNGVGYIFLARLIGDTPTIDNETPVNGKNIYVQKGEKIGFYFNTWNDDKTVNGLPDNFSIWLENPSYYGEESYSSEFAYFVKIE